MTFYNILMVTGTKAKSNLKPKNLPKKQPNQETQDLTVLDYSLLIPVVADRREA